MAIPDSIDKSGVCFRHKPAAHCQPARPLHRRHARAPRLAALPATRPTGETRRSLPQPCEERPSNYRGGGHGTIHGRESLSGVRARGGPLCLRAAAAPAGKSRKCPAPTAPAKTAPERQLAELTAILSVRQRECAASGATRRTRRPGIRRSRLPTKRRESDCPQRERLSVKLARKQRER